MSKRWCGITVAGSSAVCVDARIEADGMVHVVADHTWNLQRGDRPSAYAVVHDQVVNYLREHSVDRVVIKGSSTSGKSMGMAHLEAAELRGVILAACGGVSSVSVRTKGTVSKSFGKRKADEYLQDDDFWSEQMSGGLRKGSREAALLLLAELAA